MTVAGALRGAHLHGMAARGLQTLVLLASAALVVWRLPAEEQGLFWAFGGLGALVQAGELALTQVTLQNAAHFAARSDADSLARLWRSARRTAAFLMPAVALVVAVAGWSLLARAQAGGAAPWFAFVAGLAAAQALGPGIGFVEGALSIEESWRFQARVEAACGAVLVAALLLDAGLWSLALQAWARFAITALWLARRRARFPGSPETFGMARWRREVWPFQWRLAVTAVTSFLIYRAFTPIVLAGMGPEAAARFGLSLAVMGSWLAITVAWPSSQIGWIGTLASRDDGPALRHAFRAMLLRSTFFAAAGAALIVGALWLADQAGLRYSERSAGLGSTALLLASGVLQHAVLCASVLLRAGRADPLLPYSVAGGVITAAALWFAAASGSLQSVALAYFACSCLGLLMGLHAFAWNVAGWRSYLRAP